MNEKKKPLAYKRFTHKMVFFSFGIEQKPSCKSLQHLGGVFFSISQLTQISMLRPKDISVSKMNFGGKFIPMMVMFRDCSLPLS